MTDLSITVQGIDQLNAKFDQLQRNEILRAPMERSVVRLQRFMAKYPPAPPKSKYRRTGTLGRRWTTQIVGSAQGLTGKVGNRTIYAPEVQAEMFQSEIHKGRWQTDRDAIKKNQSTIIRDFEAAIDKALK